MNNLTAMNKLAEVLVTDELPIRYECIGEIAKSYSSCSSEVHKMLDFDLQVPPAIKSCQAKLSCTPEETQELYQIACPVFKKLGDCIKPAMDCILEGVDKNVADSISASLKKCDALVINGTATSVDVTSTETTTIDGETSTSYDATTTSVDGTSTETTTGDGETSYNNSETATESTTTDGETAPTGGETSTETATSNGETSTEILSSDGETSTIKTQTFTETVTSFDATSTSADTGETITVSGGEISFKASLISLLAITLLW
jgi:hypothetical protein